MALRRQWLPMGRLLHKVDRDGGQAHRLPAVMAIRVRTMEIDQCMDTKVPMAAFQCQTMGACHPLRGFDQILVHNDDRTMTTMGLRRADDDGEAMMPVTDGRRKGGDRKERAEEIAATKLMISIADRQWAIAPCGQSIS